MAELGLLGAQELAPRRRIEVEVRHRDRGALRARRGLHLADAARLRRRSRRACAASRVRLVIDRRDTEAIEASASPRNPIVATPSRSSQAGDLAGGVARERERQLLARDAGAVVLDLHALDAAGLEHHGDRLRAGVDAVLQQLLQHRGRALDHLARGDLADQQLRQDADRGSCEIRLGAAGDAHQLVVGQAKHRVRVAGRGPQLAVARRGSSRRRCASAHGRRAARRRWRSRYGGARNRRPPCRPARRPSAASRATSTRFAPEDMTSSARRSLARGTPANSRSGRPRSRDSPRRPCAVRAAPGSSTMVRSSPARDSASRTRSTLGEVRTAEDMRGSATIIQSARWSCSPGSGIWWCTSTCISPTFVAAVRRVGLRAAVRDRVLRNRPGGHAVPAGGLAAVRRRRGRGRGRHEHRRGDGDADRRRAVRRQRQLLGRALDRPAGVPLREARAGSTPRTCSARTPSTRSTAARPSSSRASSPSCAPTSRSSPASAPCPTSATSPSAWSAR